MKKKLIIIAVFVPVLSVICTVLYYISANDNSDYLDELAEVEKSSRIINKRPAKKLTAQQLRAQRLKQYYKRPRFTSDAVSKIMNKANGLKFRQRLAMVNSLSRNLSFEDKQALYYYLKYEKNNTQTHCMKNDMLNILRDQKNPPEELTDVMLDLFYDKDQDMVLRCYALQHMRPWYLDERMQDPQIIQAFYDGLKETDTEISGVALLGLKYMSEHNTPVDKDFISQKAAELAESEETYVLTRISAVGVCGELESKTALPTLRNLSSNPSQPTNLRMSALASLGKLGTIEDITKLEGMLKDLKAPFSTAARASLTKLKQKYNHL